MKQIHGGDWAGFQEEYGGCPLDFSANTSPLGLPEGVRQAVIASLEYADRYPDPLCRSLREALGRHYHLPAGQILCGNGAADLIFRLTRAVHPRRALITAPAFAEYRLALEECGCQPEEFLLTEESGFFVTDAILERIRPGIDLVILCEPNNPTGLTTDPALLRRILEHCASLGVLLMVDECFNDFLECPAEHTLIGELASHPNLLILRAFTKFYAMAGLRLGCILSANPALLEGMAAAGQPWSVSTPAQAAGTAALNETAYASALRALIAGERPRLRKGLEALGCRVIPGEANYLLFYHPDPALAEKLRPRGILLRECGGYSGLGPGWYRTAVRTGRENDVLLQTIREVL